MMPPLTTPGKAWWCSDGDQSATTSSPSTRLRMRRPWGLAGPQPKQARWGAKRSWRHSEGGAVDMGPP